MSAMLESPVNLEFPLGHISQIPAGEGREFIVCGEHIAVFHARNGGVYATQALCPHREGPLADGLLGGKLLTCPLHAWKFDLSTGEAASGDCALTTYPIRLDENGEIVLSLAERVSNQERPANATG